MRAVERFRESQLRISGVLLNCYMNREHLSELV